MKKHDMLLLALAITALLGLLLMVRFPIVGVSILGGVALTMCIWFFYMERFDKKYGPKFYPLDQLKPLVQAIADEVKSLYPKKIEGQPHEVIPRMGQCMMRLIEYADYKWTGETPSGIPPSLLGFGCVGFQDIGGMFDSGEDALLALDYLVNRYKTTNPILVEEFQYLIREDGHGRKSITIGCRTVHDCDVTRATRVFTTYRAYFCEIEPRSPQITETIQILALESYFC